MWLILSLYVCLLCIIYDVVKLWWWRIICVVVLREPEFLMHPWAKCPCGGVCLYEGYVVCARWVVNLFVLFVVQYVYTWVGGWLVVGLVATYV